MSRANTARAMAWLASCALLCCARPAPRSAGYEPERLQFPGFSLAPPRGPWVLSAPGADYRSGTLGVIVFRRNDAAGRQAGPQWAMVWTRDLSGMQFENDSAALRFEDTEMRAAQPYLHVKILASSTADDGSLGKNCVCFQSTLQFPEDKGEGNLLAMRGYRCLHPRWPRYSVTIASYEQYPRGQPPAALAAETQPFLESLKFDDRRPLSMVTVPLGGTPSSIVALGGSIWMNMGEEGVARLEIATGRIAALIPVAKGPLSAGGIASAPTGLWVANGEDGTVARIDPRTNRVEAVVMAGGKLLGIGACAGSIWVADTRRGQVVRIDPRAEQVAARIAVGDDPTGIACDDTSVWVTCRGSDTLVRIDPSSAEVSRRITVGRQPSALALLERSLWVVNDLDSNVVRVDRETMTVAGVVPLPAWPSAIVTGGGLVWVSVTGGVVRIDPGTGTVLGPPWPGRMTTKAAAFADDSLWLGGARELSRLTGVSSGTGSPSAEQ